MKRCHWTLPATLVLALTSACFLASARAATPPALAPTATATGVGLVNQDQAALRAAPRDAAAVQTLLWRGEALEIRAERGDYLQVWDHYRERGGFVRKAQVHALQPLGGPAATADDLLAVLAFVRQQPGAEALGLGLAAAAIQATPASRLAGATGALVLDAIGHQAERLAERASDATPRRTQDQAALSAHLDVAARHGVRFTSREVEGRMLLCYDGDAWRRLLALKAASPEAQARAALALTREDCSAPAEPATPRSREAADAARAQVLAGVAAETLAPHWKNRLLMRRAAVFASLGFARARRGDAGAAQAATEMALQALALVDKAELADDDMARYTEAALRVNAVRWAAAPAPAPASTLAVSTRVLEDGQTCVTLRDARQAAAPALAERCTWGVVWAASANANREGNALALAVQPTEGWRELWLFRKDGAGFSVAVLPPSAAVPGLGYAEFAGWVPGGQQMLVAREAIAEGRTLRRFEILKIDTLTAERQAFEPDALGAFKRWPDVAWKRDSLALR
jgi:hypothetical protein